jgi:hypothetical protein
MPSKMNPYLPVNVVFEHDPLESVAWAERTLLTSTMQAHTKTVSRRFLEVISFSFGLSMEV